MKQKMTIKEIREALVDKHLHRSDSWYGHSTFVVKVVKVKGNTVCCFARTDASDSPEYLYKAELPALFRNGRCEREPRTCGGFTVTQRYELS